MASRKDKSQVEFAKLAQRLKRYDDMAEAMNEYSQWYARVLRGPERSLLEVAYRNAYSARRSSWRVICDIEKEAEGSVEVQAIAREYRWKLEEEMKTICVEVVDLLSIHLLPYLERFSLYFLDDDDPTEKNESKVFYLKLKADYYRYMAEVSIHSDEGNSEVVEASRNAYCEAIETAEALFPAGNRFRLGTALNFAVFHYEVLKNKEEACKVARKAMEAALLQLGSHLQDDENKASYELVWLIKQNLVEWGEELDCRPIYCVENDIEAYHLGRAELEST